MKPSLRNEAIRAPSAIHTFSADHIWNFRADLAVRARRPGWDEAAGEDF